MFHVVQHFVHCCLAFVLMIEIGQSNETTKLANENKFGRVTGYGRQRLEVRQCSRGRRNGLKSDKYRLKYRCWARGGGSTVVNTDALCTFKVLEVLDKCTDNDNRR